jgi:phosphotransacetylase/acyl dehydratase
MSGYSNVTFDELAIGATVSAERLLGQSEVEALLLVSGDVVPFHVVPGSDTAHEVLSVDAVAAEAIVAGMLERRLPGPGTRIVSQQFEFVGYLRVGDMVRATVTVIEKHESPRRVVFDCVVETAGQRVLWGTTVVEAPERKAHFPALERPEFIVRRNDVFVRLLQRCEPLEPVSCAVAHPCDPDSLMGALESARIGLIRPVLVGPSARIRALAASLGADISGYRLVDTEHSHASADAAVALARSGEVETLMKGSLHTDEIMAAVVSAQGGLRTERRVSHVFVMDVPAYDRILFVTDAAINIEPNLRAKADIAQNAIDLARSLGVDVPKIAILSAVETVNPDISSTIDAAALCKMADRGQIRGAVLDGPLAFDNAISELAARTKRIDSPVAGRADILLVPNIEAGNMLAKQLQYFAGADSAGIVMGARVPVILTSRADNVRMRVGSAAVAKLVVHAHRAALRQP